MIPKALDTPLRYRWVIFWILAFSYLLVYFHRLCPAVLAVDLMRDLNATGALTGFLGAAYFYPYALMQLPAGLLSDSWGPRNTITLFFCVAFAGSIILGIAPSISWAIFGRTLVGLGVAMLFVPTMKILAEWFLASEFAFMTGILMAMGGLGSLTAATPLVWLNAWTGWRMAFFIVGGFTMLLAILVWVFVRNRPKDFGWESPTGEPAGKSDIRSISLSEGIRKVLTCPSFWPLAIWFFFTCGIFFSFAGLWGGPYLRQVYHLTQAESGRILSMAAIGLAIGSPFVSWLSGSVFRARKPVLVLSGAIVILLTAGLAFYTERMPIAVLYAVCLGLGIFCSAVVVIGFTTNKELFPIQMAGTATGIINLFPFAGGAVFQPLLGYLLELKGHDGEAFALAGYKLAFFALFLSASVAFAASLFLKETLREK